MPQYAPVVVVLARQRAILESLSRSRTLEKRIAERVQIVLSSADGVLSVVQAAALGVDPQRVNRARRRWAAAAEKLASAEAQDVTDKQLETLIRDALADAPRSGAPLKFKAEEVAQIIALACQAPKTLGLPVTHWTPRELAHEVIKRGIVASISIRQVGRFFLDAALKPHRIKNWLNPKIDNKETYKKEAKEVCDIYVEAAALKIAGTNVVSCDEKTGIQALERVVPTKPMKPNLIEKIEYEYIRHGTTCLIANFDVATGQVLAPTLGPTRTEADYALHVKRTMESVPMKNWIFVNDNLNTHVSEALVRLVAEVESIEIDLGKKGKSGVLRNMKSRRKFLTDREHKKLRFVYTPKHCSWLNQVEIWFSILSRRALKRASFASLEELSQAIIKFIDYFNEVLAKPFRWTYTGRPLAA